MGEGARVVEKGVNLGFEKSLEDGKGGTRLWERGEVVGLCTGPGWAVWFFRGVNVTQGCAHGGMCPEMGPAV